jgi:hypothetical protein
VGKGEANRGASPFCLRLVYDFENEKGTEVVNKDPPNFASPSRMLPIGFVNPSTRERRGGYAWHEYYLSTFIVTLLRTVELHHVSILSLD